MTAASEFLFRVGMFTLFAGFNLWTLLFLVAMFRDPKGSEIYAWSISTQWIAMARFLRAAAGFPVFGVLAKAIVALGVACLVLAGLASLIGLLLYGPKG